MASRVTYFLSLTLLLGELMILGRIGAGLQGLEHFQMSPKKVITQLGEKVELSCQVLLTTSQGCSWLFQKEGSGIKPTFLVYVSSTREKRNEDLHSIKFSGKKNGDKYTLTLENFRKESEGYYFCSVTGNSVVHFSPLVPVFLASTTPPTTPVPRLPTPVPTTGTSRFVRPEACRPGAVEKRGLDFDCNIFIWAPLAGICGVLLLSLVITLICYHISCLSFRPLVRQGGKPSPSEKFV
uniref:T-cell surface glycoprotein CD8 alpha chain n=1 Tax=Cricetulus griseus TaxID=10029 RepID=A0A8C2LCC9_CRIGR